MYSSGVWIEHFENGGIAIGVTDYHVSEFGDKEWEWSAHFDKENKEKLISALKLEFKEESSLKEMVSKKFGENLSTTAFVEYLDKLKIKYNIQRMWW